MFSRFGRHWSRIRDIFDGPLDADATPLEISAAVLDDLERRVQPLGGGRRRFPYTRVVVHVSQPNVDLPAIEAAFEGVGARLRERLRELECDSPDTLDVSAICRPERPAGWSDGQLYSIECTREEPLAMTAAPASGRGVLCVSVLQGAASQGSYRFDEAAVYVGRTVEAVDRAGRLRRNHVGFLDTTDGITETVGRAHACFRRQEATGEYRIFDEGSSNGTWVVRRGTAMPVVPHDPRGVRIESGDEVRLGRALLRVAIEIVDAQPAVEHSA